MNLTGRRVAWQAVFKWCAVLAIPLVLYGIFLAASVDDQIGLYFRFNFLGIVLLSFFIFAVGFSLPGWVGKVITPTLVLLMFAMPLSGLWGSAANIPYVYKGLIPFSDAGSYYIDALRLLDGGLFSNFASKRPLFPAMLAALLWLTGRNLQWTLAILVAITATCCYLAAREVQRTHGKFAATLFLVILFFYFRRYVGIASSENLGLALGALGFAALWRGISDRNLRRYLFGILLVTLGLDARAGAFFILPVLALWGAWFFRNKAKYTLKVFGLGVGAILIGMGLNMLLLRVTAPPSGEAFGNFSQHLYGLVVGGQGWDQVYIDHPEVRDAPSTYNAIYRLAWEEFRSNPYRTITGATIAVRDFFTSQSMGIFSFIRGPIDAVSTLVVLSMLWVFSGLTFVRCFFRGNKAAEAFILFSLVGIAASTPFATPADSDVMRAYATTIPFTAVLPSAGLFFLLSKVKFPKILSTSLGPINGVFTEIVGGGLVVFVMLMPMMIRLTARPAVIPVVECQPGQSAVYVRFNLGSYINIVKDSSGPVQRPTTITQTDFTHGKNYSFGRKDFLDEVSDYAASFMIMQALDVSHYRNILVFGDPKEIPNNGNVGGLCGIDSQTPVGKSYNIFYTNGFLAEQSPEAQIK